MDKYIGFDIDGKKVVACVVENGKKDLYQTLGPDIGSMRKFLLSQRRGDGRVHLAFEISGQAGFIHDELAGCVDSIHVANPSKMTWIYRTDKKNDRIDARKMAVLLSIGELPTVYMPSPEVRQWRQTILHRRNIVSRVTSVKNRIRASLKSRGHGKAPNSGSWWKPSNMEWMRQCAGEALAEGHMWAIGIEQLLDELAFLGEQLKRLTARLDSYLASQPGGNLLMTIPGIGPRTAESVLAYTDDVSRFARSKQFCSYYGLTPRLDESGSIRRLGHISKQGPSVVRWALCEAAWKVVRKSGAMKVFYERVMAGQSGRKKIAIVAVCRKLLSIMRAMLVSGEVFNETLVGRHCGRIGSAA